MHLSDARTDRPKRMLLEPSERIAEVLFGLIMVLTFTGSLSAAEAGREDIRAMLIGALGCNIACGIIDGVLYLMGSLGERGSNLIVYRAVRGARGRAAGRGCWAGGRADSRARAAGEEADRGGQAGEVRARGADADRHQRA